MWRWRWWHSLGHRAGQAARPPEALGSPRARPRRLQIPLCLPNHELIGCGRGQGAPLRFSSVWSPGLGRADGQPSGTPALRSSPPAAGRRPSARGLSSSRRCSPRPAPRDKGLPALGRPLPGAGRPGRGGPREGPGCGPGLRAARSRSRSGRGAPGSAMVQAWYMDESADDPRLPHRTEPARPVGLEQLRRLGVLYWKVPGTTAPKAPALARTHIGARGHRACSAAGSGSGEAGRGARCACPAVGGRRAGRTAHARRRVVGVWAPRACSVAGGRGPGGVVGWWVGWGRV